MAAIYITIVQKCARMLIKGKPIEEELNGGGMYINKVVAPFLGEDDLANSVHKQKVINYGSECWTSRLHSMPTC